jgi:hypothetical protein
MGAPASAVSSTEVNQFSNPFVALSAVSAQLLCWCCMLWGIFIIIFLQPTDLY